MEFMVATAIFSVVLLMCSFAILHVGRMFYKGVITNRTQDVARKLSEDISDNIRFGVGSSDPAIFYDEVQTTSGAAFPSGTSAYIRSVCVGTSRFTFSTLYAPASIPPDRRTAMPPMGASAGSVNVGLWKDRRDSPNSACTVLNINIPAAVADSATRLGGQELLTEKMRVSRFDVVQAPVDGSLWAVNVRISFGDDNVLFEDGADASRCRGTNAGGQFCAVSDLSTQVTKRL